jgi:type IV secretory pathway TrbL component
MMFRKISQAFGVILSLVGILAAGNWLVAALVIGTVPIWLGTLMAIICLGFIAGLGMLLIFFDPHQVLQNYYMSFHRLVEPQGERKSFGERIGAGDDED